MSRWTPVVLLVLLAAAGTYVVFFELREETRLLSGGEIQERQARVFDVERTDAVSDGMTGFSITHDGQAVVFARAEDKRWRIVSPVRALAEQDKVRGLVNGLLFMKKIGEDVPKENLPAGGLAAFGLDKPAVIVVLEAAEGEKTKQYSLRLGAIDPTQRFVYAQRAGDDSVMVLDRGILETLTHPVNDYRETGFVGFDRRRVRTLTVRSRAGEVELAREGDAWMLAGPCRDRADSLRIEDCLAAVEKISARSFVAEEAGNLAPFGLDMPRIQVGFARDDNTTSTVLIGAAAKDPPGTVYAKLADEPAIYATDDSIVKALSFGPEYLRDRRLAHLSEYAVSEFSIEGSGPRLVVQRLQGAWKITEPVKMDAEPEAVSAFLRDLASLAIIRFANDAPDQKALADCGLDEKSRIAITVKPFEGAVQVFYVGKVDPRQRDLYVQRKGFDSIYTVKESWRGVASVTWLDFRARLVARMSRQDMRQLVIRRAQGEVVLAMAADGKWRMTAPASAPADELSVNNLLDDLSDLQAAKFLTEKAANLADYGLAKPAYEVIVELKPARDKPPETKTLLIGREIAGTGFAAKLKDEDLVFVVTPTLVERLGKEMRNHLVWEITPNDVSSAVWQGGSARAVVRAEGGEWKVIEPAQGVLDLMRFGEIMRAATYIRVERFESYARENLPKYGLDRPRATLTLTVAGRDRTLSVGAQKDKDGSYAMVSDDDAVFTLPTSSVNALLASPLAAPEKPEPAKPGRK